MALFATGVVFSVNNNVVFYHVSVQGIPDLKKSIVKVALQQKYMGEKIPEAWLNLEKKLISLREKENKDFLPFRQMEAVSQSVGIFDRNEVISWCWYINVVVLHHTNI